MELANDHKMQTSITLTHFWIFLDETSKWKKREFWGIFPVWRRSLLLPAGGGPEEQRGGPRRPSPQGRRSPAAFSLSSHSCNNKEKHGGSGDLRVRLRKKGWGIHSSTNKNMYFWAKHVCISLILSVFIFAGWTRHLAQTRSRSIRRTATPRRVR